jgi:hypothetical protein
MTVALEREPVAPLTRRNSSPQFIRQWIAGSAGAIVSGASWPGQHAATKRVDYSENLPHS